MKIIIGSIYVIEGRMCEVIDLDPGGHIHIVDGMTLESRWIDFYLAEIIDPSESDEALLTALGTLSSNEEDSEDVPKEEPKQAIQPTSPPAFPYLQVG